MKDESRDLIIETPAQLGRPETRRSFVRTLSLGGTIVLLPSLFACDDDDDPIGPNGDDVVLNLSNDIGIFNYAYALEQLEAAFYTQVVARFSAAGITNATEQSILTDIRDHEVIHRQFFHTALGGSRIADLEVDFGNALATRQSILEAARTFEDLGVAAYNGAGKYLSDARNLLVAGKIVSVEARHASVIRDLLDTTGRAFANNADDEGLDQAFEPSVVLTAAAPFIETDVSIGTQPTA